MSRDCFPGMPPPSYSDAFCTWSTIVLLSQSFLSARVSAECPYLFIKSSLNSLIVKAVSAPDAESSLIIIRTSFSIASVFSWNELSTIL